MAAAAEDAPYVWTYASPRARVEPTDLTEGLGLGVGRLLLAAVDPVLSPRWLRAVGVLPLRETPWSLSSAERSCSLDVVSASCMLILPTAQSIVSFRPFLRHHWGHILEQVDTQRLQLHSCSQ